MFLSCMNSSVSLLYRRPNFCTKLGTSDVKMKPHSPKCFPLCRVWYRLDFINASSDSVYPSDPVSSSVLDTTSYNGHFCKKEMFIKKQNKTLYYLYNKYFVHHVYHNYCRLVVVIFHICISVSSLTLFDLIHKSGHAALMLLNWAGKQAPHINPYHWILGRF